MKKKIQYIVPVEQITWEGVDLDIDLGSEWFDQWHVDDPSLDFAQEDYCRGQIHLERHERDILLRGHLTGALTCTCSRCLALYAEPLVIDFDLLLHQGQEPVSEEEIELTAAELDEDYFLGEELDLTQYLREQILLALPLKPLCRQDCLGLCPRCGADLNQGPCGCEKQQFNPAFAKLKKLQND